MVELETTSAADTSLLNGATTAAPKSEPTTIKTVSVSEFVDASFASFDRVYGDSPTSRKSVSALKDTTNSSSSSSSSNDDDDDNNEEEEQSSSFWEVVVTWYLPVLFFWIRKSMFGTANLIRSLLLGHFLRMVFQQIIPEEASSDTSPSLSLWLWDHLSPWIRSLLGGDTNSSSIASNVNKPDPHAWPPPALTTLAILTIMAFVVHPDGPTWIMLGKIRDGIMSLFHSTCAMVRDYGIIPTMFAATTLAALGFLLQIMHRTLKHKKLESNQRTNGTVPTLKKKKRKGHHHHHHGRGGGGGGGHHGGGNHRGRIKTSSNGVGINNNSSKQSHTTTITPTSNTTTILSTKPIPERKAVHNDEHDDLLVGNISLTTASSSNPLNAQNNELQEAVSPARQRMMSSSTAETLLIADDQSCGSTSVMSIASAPTTVSSMSVGTGKESTTTGKFATDQNDKNGKKKTSRSSKRRQKGKRNKKSPTGSTPTTTPTTTASIMEGDLGTAASGSINYHKSSSAMMKNQGRMNVSSPNNFELTSSKTYSTDVPFSHSPFTPNSPALSASSVPTRTELKRRENRRSTNQSRTSKGNTANAVAPPPGLASSKSLMQPKPYHHRPLSTNKHQPPLSITQPMLSSPYNQFSNNTTTEQHPSTVGLSSSSTSLRPTSGGAQPYRHPNSTSRIATTTSIPPGLSGNRSHEAATTQTNITTHNTIATPPSPPVRYTLPNYSNYYAHDARYTPGKMELASFLAQVGLVGTACAQMLHDLNDVDALLTLSDSQYRSYNITSAKQAQIDILLNARREKKEQLQQAKNFTNSINFGNVSSNLHPPSSPGLSSSTGGNTPVRPPPGLEGTGPSPTPSFLMTSLTATATKDDAILPLMPSILQQQQQQQQQQHSSLCLSPSNWEADNAVSMMSSSSPSPSMSPTSMLLPRLEDGCTTTSCLDGRGMDTTNTTEPNNTSTDFLADLGVNRISEKPSRTLFGTPFEQDGGESDANDQVAALVDDDDESSQIEADLQELGGQMVGSILDF